MEIYRKIKKNIETDEKGINKYRKQIVIYRTYGNIQRNIEQY